MEVKLLFLTVVLLSSPLLTLCDPLFVLSAPNLLRVGSSENLFVEAQDYSGAALDVKIIVKNHPKKDKEILSKSVTLTADNNFQILTDIKIPSDQNYFSDDPLEKQYVYLQAQFPSVTLEKVVLLSFQSGYIFVQTDKPIYTPASTVLYRIFSLTPNMTPRSESGITVKIMNPQGITVSSEKIFPVRGMKSGGYSIPQMASSGIWKVVTLFSNTPQETFTADFEVKEYVLPTCDVKLKLSKSFFYVGDESLTVDIEAKYLFGQKVDGNAFVVFGVMEDEKKTSIPASLQKVQIVKGKGIAKLTNQMITETFPNINQLVGRSIYVSVSLLTESGSEMVEAERRGIQIVTSPYTIHFKKTPHFFKPGMPFDVSVIYVTNPDQTPAENVEVEVNPGGVRGRTRDNGIAKVTVNTPRGSSALDITAKTKDPKLRDEQQAVRKMTAQAYETKGGSNNYLYIGIDAAELQIGDPMRVYLGTGQSPGVSGQDFTYMILSKGQIVKADRFKRSGESLVTLPVTVTKDMVPSFRFVAYYHVGSSEVVSDSVWVDVKDTCMGTLQIDVKEKMYSYRTGDEVKLQITGDPGAKVGLVVVDKAVNKNRLTQTKIWDIIEKHDTGCTAGGGRDSMGVFTDAGLMFESSTAGGTNTRTSMFVYFCISHRLLVSLSPESRVCLRLKINDVYSECPYKWFYFYDFVLIQMMRELISFSCFHQVRVEFMETEDVCSSASKKGKYRTTVSVDKGSSIAVSYVIIPMTLGNHDIEVKASAYEAMFSDGVRKTLKVVSEGVLISLRRENVELNPAKNAFKADIPADRLPDTPADTYISITAEEITQTVEQAISGSFMGRFIVQPRGSGEQNMMLMTLPLIATHYLDSTNQWDTVGMERRNEAVNHISTGYQRQLGYRKSDGSYAAWRDRPSSTWLTAYVAKVFSMAHNLVIIEENVICSALKWLMLHKQIQDGSFKEESAVMQGEMVGDVRGKDADASLTAFVVIAMQEASEICAGPSLHLSIMLAVSFLEGRLPQLTNPYAIAMTSYAMANANKLNKDILMKHSTQHEAGRSWTVPGQHHHSLEATAYAVLALVKDKDFDKAGEAVHWLNRQQSHYGGSGTTQATIMVFQAVAEYRTQVKDRQNFNLNVELSVAGRSKPVRWAFKRDNMHLTRSDKVEINQEFNVTAKGTGTATLSVLTLYYARPVEKKSDCTFFDLTVKMEKDPEQAIASYKLTMDFYYKSDKTDATMTILEIGIPTGFTVETRDLEELSSGKERYIQKYENNKVLSERGSLILYLDKVSHKEKEVISFRMHKLYNVGLLQPAAVTIYEYYSPDARCTKFFHPERTNGALYKLCKGDLCQCAEVNCSYQKKNRVSDEERLNKACEAGMDYVYKATVVGMDLKQDSDIYDMKVELVLKKGTDEEVEGKVRLFLARPSCRGHLGLVEGKSYLIMGRSVDLPKLGGSLQYILGEQTWIEYWPTREESPTPEHRERYIGITKLKNSLLRYRCTS
uniref:Complement C3-like n=1 Tax=Sinocyclocheilus grahami TaxID=75366 RepID=A0A672Q200_SINGR